MYYTYVSPEGSTIYNNTEFSNYSNGITKIYDDLEKIRFVSSGTEAVMSAIRLARGVTGKDKIIKFILNT